MRLKGLGVVQRGFDYVIMKAKVESETDKSEFAPLGYIIKTNPRKKAIT